MNNVPWNPSMVNAGLTSALSSASLALLSTTIVDGKYIEKYSLQSLVELIYVKQGNDLLGSALNSLQDALDASQKASTVLAQIQNLHNQIGVSGASANGFPLTAEEFDNSNNNGYPFTVSVRSYNYTDLDTGASAVAYITPPTGNVIVNFSGLTSFPIGDKDQYRSIYNTLGSAYFRNIAPTFQVTIPASGNTPATTSVILNASQPAYQWFTAQLDESRTNLSTYIGNLSALTPPGASTNPNSGLIGALKKVLDQMPPAGAPFSVVRKWVLDGNDLTGAKAVDQAGVFQKDLGLAITAAQSLNSTQNQSVRRYMFIFQQYQQSAAAILSALQQLFHSMASGISRT